MSAEAEEKWYYSGAGVTLGPISFEELRAKAANKALDPPMQVVRSTRMNEWKKAEEIEGLFGEEAPSLPVNQGKELQGDWYYVQGKDKKGPVPLRVLKEMVENASLKQPVRMVWTAGMGQWLQVSEVEALEGSLRKLKQKVQEKIEHQRESLLQRRAAEEELKKKEEDESAAARREAAMSAMRVQEARAIAEREERLRSAAESRALAKERMENRGVKQARVDGAAGNPVVPPPIEGDTTPTKQDRQLPELGAKVPQSEASGRVSTSAASGEDDEISRKAQQKMEKEARMKAEAELARQGMVKSGGLRARLGRLLGKKPQDLSVMAAKAKEEESARRAEEEQRWQDELAQRNQAKQEKRRSEQQASKVDDEASRKVEEEIKQAAAAREKAEAEAKALAIAKEKAEAEAKQATEAKARVEELLRKAEAAKIKAEEEARKAEAERLRMEQEARALLEAAKNQEHGGDTKQAAKAKKHAEVELNRAEKAEAKAQEKAVAHAEEEQRLRDEAKEMEREELRAKEVAVTKSKENELAAAQIEALRRAEAQRTAFATARAAQLAKMATAQKQLDQQMGVKPKAQDAANQARISAIQEARKLAMITSRSGSSTNKPDSQGKGDQAGTQPPKPAGVVTKPGMEEPPGRGKPDGPEHRASRTV